MVKKLKQLAASKDDNQLAKAVRESAQQIWLAGLGAFAKARAERTKVFEALAKEGKNIQLRTRALAEERLGEVADKVSDVTEKVGKQATESWDRLEQVFENRVSRALGRLGVPSGQDIEALLERIDALTASVEALGGKVPAKRVAAGAAKKPARGAKVAAKASKPAKASEALKASGAAGPAKAPAARKAKSVAVAAAAKPAVKPAAKKAPRKPRAKPAAAPEGGAAA